MLDVGALERSRHRMSLRQQRVRGAANEKARRHRARLHRVDRTDSRIFENRGIARAGVRLDHSIEGAVRVALNLRGEIEQPVNQQCSFRLRWARIFLRCQRRHRRRRKIAARGIAANRQPRRISVPSPRVLAGPLHRMHAVVETGGKRMLGRQAIIDVDRQISRLGELHSEFAMRFRTASDPSAAVQINDHRMRPVALGHRDIGGETRPNFDGLMKRANLRKILIHHRRERFHQRPQRLHVGRHRSLRHCLKKGTFLFSKHCDFSFSASPVISQERRPAASRPVGERSAESG